MAGAYLGNKPPVETSTGNETLSRTEVTWLIAAFGVGILILFLAVLRGFDKLAEARERDIYSQRVELERVKWTLSGGRKTENPQKDPAYAASLISAGLSKAPAEMERLLKNPYLAVRSKGLIILEAEMLGNEGQKRAAARLLEPLLYDRDALISANAARALAGFDINKGMSVLEKMASGDRQQRVAALHVMGWVRSERGAKILLKHISETDGKLAAAAINGLKLLKEAKFAGLTPKTASEADRVLTLMTVKKGAV